MPEKIDLTGQPFGRYTVIRECGRKNGHVAWLCRCECGVEKVVSGNHLRKGAVLSCGCLRDEKLAARSTKHGLMAEHKRLLGSITKHIETIRNPYAHGHKHYKYLRIPAKYLGASGAARLAQEVIKRYPKEAEEYERNKSLELDKDISGDLVFAPCNIRFVTREENLSCRKNTIKIGGTPLANICREEGISTRVNGRKSPEYNCISRMWREDQKIHPILWNARKQNLEREERLLEMTKLRVRHAELMIEGLKKLTTSKSDTLDARSC